MATMTHTHTHGYTLAYMEADACPSAGGNYVPRTLQWCHMAGKNDEHEGEAERGSSTEKETLCREWVRDEIQLHVGDATHTNTKTHTHTQEDSHISFVVNR